MHFSFIAVDWLKTSMKRMTILLMTLVLTFTLAIALFALPVAALSYSCKLETFTPCSIKLNPGDIYKVNGPSGSKIEVIYDNPDYNVTHSEAEITESLKNGTPDRVSLSPGESLPKTYTLGDGGTILFVNTSDPYGPTVSVNVKE